LKTVTVKEYGHLRRYAVYARDSPIFRKNISRRSSGSKSSPTKKPRRADGKLRKPPDSAGYSSNLMREAICSSETSDSFRYIWH
jgi:hypothetical protein